MLGVCACPAIEIRPARTTNRTCKGAPTVRPKEDKDDSSRTGPPPLRSQGALTVRPTKGYLLTQQRILQPKRTSAHLLCALKRTTSTRADIGD